MQASITIGGIEVALTTAPGELEKAVAERYAPFLGAVEAPVCSILLESNRGHDGLSKLTGPGLERMGETEYEVTHRALSGVVDIAGKGVFDLAPSPQALDTGLRMLFGLLAPYHDALLLHATSVIGEDGAHVFMGASEPLVLGHFYGARATMTDGMVLVRREWGGWLAASTPFWASYQDPGPAREDKLSRLWALEKSTAPDAVDVAEVSRIIAEHTFRPTADADHRRGARWVGERLAADVPLSVLRLVPPPLTWADVDAGPWAPVG